MCDTLRFMKLFLIAGMPLFLVLVLNLFFTGAFDQRGVIRSAIGGILWFFPALIVYGIVAGFFPAVYEGKGLYLSRTLLDFLIPILLGAGAYVYSYRRDLISPGGEQFLRAFSFLTGFFTLFSQYSLITYTGWSPGYLYFLLPLFRMILVLEAAFVLGVFFSDGRITGLIFLFVGLSIPFLFGAVSYLYIVNFRFFSWLLTLLLFGGSLFAFRRGLSFLT